MARALSLWPTILFGGIEPALMIYAYYILLQDPKKFYIDQMPASFTASLFTPQAELETLLLGNVYLVLALMCFVCIWQPSRSTAKYYLAVIALGDLGHIFATYRVWGQSFWNLNEWNDMMWGNVGASAFLHVNRLATIFDLFGKK